MTEQCNRCRFWKFVTSGDADEDDQPYGWGWCRRYPPKVSDHMASITIGTPDFRQQYCRDEMANEIAVSSACLLPATFSRDWCGEFASVEPEMPIC